MKLGSDFRELLTLLNECGVKYLVVGGYAMAAHGSPRNTKDLDIFVEATPENAERLIAALDRFGFGGLGLSAADFDHATDVVQLGYPPNRVDLMSDISGVSFAEAYESRIISTGNGVEFPVIGKSALVKNKRATRRLTDLADVELLEGPA